jgi:hypothetical protein
LAFGYFASESSEELAAFQLAAGLGTTEAAHTFDAAIAARHGITAAPAIVLFKKVLNLNGMCEARVY